ncbi:MAG: heme exporter protein CcmB [Hyphomicrobiaceae bacterium]|nr:heme exporter protein CcmB [Hyphomicrobiaceae bacterium]
MYSFKALIWRDITLAARDGSALGTALGFFLIVIALIPLGLGPDINLLMRIAAGVLWVALLLAALLSMGRLFANDFDDGSLEVFATSQLPLEGVSLAKIIAHWLTTALPLVLAAPVLGILLNLDVTAMPVLLASMLIGSPAISAIGAVGAALTLGNRKGGLLTAVLVLPLYVPTLIFGVAAVDAALTSPTGAIPALLILAAISIAAAVLAPFAAAAALRVQLQ